MIEDATDVRHARIVWRCRRGMRELDLLLEGFLATGLGSLDDDDLDRLEDLLVQPDQDILAWLMGAREPENAEICRIVTILRSTIHVASKADD